MTAVCISPAPERGPNAHGTGDLSPGSADLPGAAASAREEELPAEANSLTGSPNRTEPAALGTPNRPPAAGEPETGKGRSRRPKRPRREEGLSGEEESGRRPSPVRRSGHATASSTPGPAGSAPLQAMAAEEEAAAANETAPPRRPRPSMAAASRDTERLAQENVDMRTMISISVRELAQAERRHEREKTVREMAALGRCRRSVGAVGTETVWEGGTAAEDIEAAKVRISTLKQQVQNLTATVSSLKKSLAKPKSMAHSAEGPAPSPEEEEARREEEAWEQKELLVNKQEDLKREEQDQRERQERLSLLRWEHQRRLRILDEEDQLAPSGPLPIQNNRYALLRLLKKREAVQGASGTIWTYRAHDLTSSSSPQRLIRVQELDGKALDHSQRVAAALRECEVLRNLKHKDISGLLDFYATDGGSFVTVWEYFQGDWADVWIRHNGPMLEKEARGPILQLLSALRFLEAKGHHVDAKDLKTSRLMVRGGEVKMTSLTVPSLRVGPGGLRPLMRDASAGDETARPTEELPNSQMSIVGLEADAPFGGMVGAYHAALNMLGAFVHELVFGRTLLSRGSQDTAAMALGADLGPVQLPEQPKISNDCKEFLQRLLIRHRHLNVQDAFQDPFVVPKVTKRQS